MRFSTPKSWSFGCVALLALTVACGDDKADEAGADGTGSETAGESGGMTGDGDGDMTTGDGDGDMTTGDGDGDMTTGDGDGDMTTGDGDGDPTAGDGDGDPNSPCFALETADECDANAECQSVMGSAVKTNGPDAPCLEAPEFLGCIPSQGCGDALTWFCVGPNKQFLVNDTCGPENGMMCDGPADPVDMCPP